MAETEDDVILKSADEDSGEGKLKNSEKEREMKKVSDDEVKSSENSDEKLEKTEDERVETEEKKDPRSALEKLADEPAKESVSWGWSNLTSWGSSVLNSATSSVSTFTSQVGEGLHQVLETVESKLVEPDDGLLPDSSIVDQQLTSPEVIDESPKPKSSDTDSIETDCGSEPSEFDDEKIEDDDKQGWFGGWSLSDMVNKTTSVVQQTVEQTTNVSKKVVSSGLDVLETIGKKTYGVLAEGDHGIKKTIELSRKNKPNLSQMLREAKEQAEERAKEEEEFLESRKCHYGAQFDDFQGLVQLEALEMLSGASEGKVRGLLDILPKETKDALKPDMSQMKQTFEDTSQEIDDDDTSDDHDFHQLLMSYVGALSLNVNIQKISECQTNIRQWIDDYHQKISLLPDSERNPLEVHEKAVQSMAEFTAYSIEHFHRSGQLILQNKSIPLTLFPSMATALAGLTKLLCKEMTWQSTQFVNCLASSVAESDESVTERITSIYLESSNSSTYIQNGFQLLLPIVQLATIQAHPMCQSLATE